MHATARGLLLAACVATAVSTVAAEALTDQEVRARIIQESIHAYPGNCPCPNNTDRADRRCGGRSAYSRAGGYSPACYEGEVSDAEVTEYRKRHKIPQP